MTLGGAAMPAPPNGDPSIGFEDVTVSYRGNAVLRNLTLKVEPGEILAVIGPSGCGKTTALRAAAGFVRPVQGRIRIGQRDVTELPPYARGLGMVVQNYALFPHMLVEENVAFGLRARRAGEATVRERVKECLRMVGMSDFTGRYPRELSGGQQQRIAIARALAIRPIVLLLDEPLSALDAQIRRNMLEELAQLHRTLPELTILYVTHDQTEALTLADRIAIMRDGRLISHGPSRELYQSPPNRFTAEFLGRANLLPVRMESLEQGGRHARVRFRESPLLAEAQAQLRPGVSCLLCIRPHDLTLEPKGMNGNVINARVLSTLWQGDQLSIAVDAEGMTLRLASHPLAEPPRVGDSLHIYFGPESATLIAEDDG